jgi:hypothetical protein
MLEILGLDHGTLVVNMREEAVRLYEEWTSLRYIERYCPIVARALKRLLESDIDSLSPGLAEYRAKLEQKRREALAYPANTSSAAIAK